MNELFEPLVTSLTACPEAQPLSAAWMVEVSRLLSLGTAPLATFCVAVRVLQAVGIVGSAGRLVSPEPQVPDELPPVAVAPPVAFVPPVVNAMPPVVEAPAAAWVPPVGVEAPAALLPPVLLPPGAFAPPVALDPPMSADEVPPVAELPPTPLAPPVELDVFELPLQPPTPGSRAKQVQVKMCNAPNLDKYAIVFSPILFEGLRAVGLVSITRRQK